MIRWWAAAHAGLLPILLIGLFGALLYYIPLPLGQPVEVINEGVYLLIGALDLPKEFVSLAAGNSITTHSCI